MDSSQKTWGPAKGLMHSRCSINVVLNPELGYSNLEPILSPSSLPSSDLHFSSTAILYIKCLLCRQPEVVFPKA